MNYGEETLRALAGDEFERLHWLEYRPAAKPPGLYLTREKAGALPLDNPLRGRHPTGDLDAPVLPVPFTAAQFVAFERMAGPHGLVAQLTDDEVHELRTTAPAAHTLARAAIGAGNVWTIETASNAIAEQERWDIGARDVLRQQLMQAARDGALSVRHPKTDLPYLPEPLRGWYELLTAADVNHWLESIGAPYRWLTESVADGETPEPDSKEAPPPLLVADDAPLPLTTGEIAYCFAGLRWNSEAEWKKPLGDKPKWLQACIATPGRRGVSEARWNPVCIGAALVHQGHEKANSVRARFQSQRLLKPWFDAWKTYEADYLDSP